MNKVSQVLVIALFELMTFGASAKEVSDQQAAENAVIISGKMTTGPVNGYTASLLSIDGAGFFLSDAGELVKPGVHTVKVGASHLSYGSFSSTVQCNTVGGHIYQVSQDRCVDLGVSTAAGRYFKIQEDKQVQERTAADLVKYQEYKQALTTPQQANLLKEMLRNLESKSGGFKDDPDGLLAKVKMQLQPILEDERKQAAVAAAEMARLNAIKEKEAAAAEAKRVKEAAAAEARRAKEEAMATAQESKKIAAFRKSLVEGDETNCGPVIESKGKLVKIAFAVSGYGNEHWIRREAIFPSGYGCRFINGQYQTPQL